MTDTNLPSIFIRFDPGGKIGITHSEKRETVKIGYLYFIFCNNFIEKFNLTPAEIRRIKMRAITHDLNPLKADPGNFFYRLRQGKILKSVGAVTECHGWILT